MLNTIEINTLNHRKYSQNDKHHFNHKQNYNLNTTNNKPPSPNLNNENKLNMKQIVPIKEYSNKFLR